MSHEQKALLLYLKDCRDRGGASVAIHGHLRAVAHELRTLGYAEWHGISWGSNFYYITDKGMEAL